jgi:2-oxoglutarate dehydrogenase E1 component
MLNVPKSEPEASPSSLSLGFIEGLYADYMADPSSVSADWRQYFQKLANGQRNGLPPRTGPSFRPSSLFNPPSKPGTNGVAGRHDLEMALLQDRADQLVRAYRVRGHMVADLDPLGM